VRRSADRSKALTRTPIPWQDRKRHVRTRHVGESGPLTLVSSIEHGLSERLAGRVDGHLAAFAFIALAATAHGMGRS